MMVMALCSPNHLAASDVKTFYWSEERGNSAMRYEEKDVVEG